ncbi:hypothetical protein K3X13_15515 (plasmid) [Aliiroseovarius crassostreae]|uniref:adenylate/guanylate cyclase domain-containing protein n=1 Tax=Aliiroseovarius crassostreae TaxID=154981 RepID=UPI00220B54FF|nr:adenylate/guanylate cyclase domain-containing protein [Aliiroseovarius crassostreae]UWP90905.1 hypothetical protein K3J57_15480 [Aliiroseovarius crassostreae]UWP93892.1 hypothetical protein K3X13_15515 [Aliiroseovarius crassostreae]UWQ03569.1 hypothetical protein K3X44_15735 [Aliiroseovarius crassostreae]
MSGASSEAEREILRLKRRLERSQLRRAELEHLIDTGQSFQRRVLAEVETAKAELEKLHAQLQKEQRRTEKLLHSIMPETVAHELRQNGGVVPRRFENATVMFADFVGFTAHAETLDPMILVQILDQYYSEFDRIAAKHGVEKVKTIGDAYMCVAGLSDDVASADRMLQAAQNCLTYVKTVRPFGITEDMPLWQIRIGINSGPVSTGVIGQDRLSFDVWGDTVNLAARLVRASHVNSMLLSESTFELLRRSNAFRSDGQIDVRGRGPVNIFRPAQDYSI